jgi:hypothetical protein
MLIKQREGGHPQAEREQLETDSCAFVVPDRGSGTWHPGDGYRRPHDHEVFFPGEG